jgi:hypothetical protein
MKRVSPFLGGLLVLLTAIPASAASVVREYAPLPDLIEDTTCGYLLEVTFPVSNEYALSFYDGAGTLTRIEITGHLVATFSNPANGASLTANISGPVSINAVTGTVTASGRGGGPLPGIAGLVIFAGRTDDGGATHGRVLVDICAALA